LSDVAPSPALDVESVKFGFAAGESLDEIDDTLADFRLLDAHEGEGELQTLAARQKFHHRRTRMFVRMQMFVLPVRHILVKIGDRNTEDIGDLIEPSRADAIHAFLVFLYLLKR